MKQWWEEYSNWNRESADDDFLHDFKNYQACLKLCFPGGDAFPQLRA